MAVGCSLFNNVCPEKLSTSWDLGDLLISMPSLPVHPITLLLVVSSGAFSRRTFLVTPCSYPFSQVCCNSLQVQDKTEDETSSLRFTADDPIQLEGEGRTLTVGPEPTEAVVTVTPVKPETQDEIPDLDSEEQACTKVVPSRAPVQREEDDESIVLLGVSTEVTLTEVPLQNEVKTSAASSETICLEATESDSTVTEAPTHRKTGSSYNLASACPDIAENGSTVLIDISPKKCGTPNSLAEEETLEKEQKLVEASNCQDFQKEDDKNEQLVERAKKVFESGQQETVRGDECSTAVQQEALTMQEEGSDLASLQAESLEALKVPVPVEAAAAEHVVAGIVTSAGTTDETAQPLVTVPEQMASEEVPVTALDCSGCGTAEPASAEALEPQVTPAPMNGVLEEQEAPQSTEQPKQNGILLSDSFTCTEFEKDVVQSSTIESQSTKIVLNAIQTAVHKLAETEESAAFESEQRIKTIGKSPSDTKIPELLESTQVDRQLSVKEEEEIFQEEIRSKEQELEQLGIVKTAALTESAEIHATVVKTKDMLLTSEMLKDGQGQNSLMIVTTHEDVSGESVRLQKSTLEISTSENSAKDPLDRHLAKLREKEVGQIMEIPDQHRGQQTCRESEEEQYHPPVEDGKTQPWEDDSFQEGTSCESPQSQNSVAPEALNVSTIFSQQFLSFSKIVLRSKTVVSPFFLF